MTAIPNCRDNMNESNMTAISAPYNFVPLSDYVHIPEWSPQVSHDWPFQDGYSGEIHYTLIADSPLLVGGEQQRNNANDRPNTEVHPFRLPDGRHAIPGSSLKGMLRAVTEIVGFGRMRMVDEQRPGLRDISGKYVSASYKDKLEGGKVKTGFLLQTANGGTEIIPCHMVRLSHRDIEEALGTPKPVFKARATVREKYQKWKTLCDKKGWESDRIPFSIDEYMAKPGSGNHHGFPVFTGQISDSTRKDGKYKDFVFYNEAPDQAIEIDTKAWRDFLFIHADEEENSDRPWNGYWRRIFRQGGKVPVFYVQNEGVLRIGLAYMPKLAGDFTTLDCIGHVSPKHLEAPGTNSGYDFADLLFGAINGDEPESALKGRISVEMAIAEGECKEVAQEDTILNGPKPSYFPNYLQQKVDASTHRLAGQQYSTYMQTPKDKAPKVRGFKRYPARSAAQTGVQKLNNEQLTNRKVQVRLHPLREGARFRGRIAFHNLKREELGLLLWVLTWGGDKSMRHGLGMGKSFGFGQVHFELDHDQSRLIANDPDSTESESDLHTSLDRAMSSFERHMETTLKAHGGWRRSPQMLDLKAMADPVSATSLTHGMELRHMCLAPKKKTNEFVWAKHLALALADYATASKFKRREEELHEQLKKKAAEEEKARRNQQAEQQKQAEKARYEALPEHEKRKVDFETSLEKFSPPIRKDEYGEFITWINQYAETAKTWPLQQRQAAAELIRQKLEEYNAWAQPGIKSNKKKKQREKREKQLRELVEE